MPRLALCAPVPWPLAELGGRLAATAGGGAFQVSVVPDSEKEHPLGFLRLDHPQFSFVIQPEPPDPRMAEAFDLAADRIHPTLGDDELAAMETEQKAVLYAVSEVFDEDEAALATARRGLFVAATLLEAGALGIKCETSGIAHGRQGWVELEAQVADAVATPTDEGLFTLFTALINTWVRRPLCDADDLLSTCGMHILARPEVAIYERDAGDEFAALRMLDLFGAYQCAAVGRDDLQDGSGFQIALDEPRFVLSRQRSEYPEDEILHNPWGTWLLRGDRD